MHSLRQVTVLERVGRAIDPGTLGMTRGFVCEFSQPTAVGIMWELRCLLTQKNNFETALDRNFNTKRYYFS